MTLACDLQAIGAAQRPRYDHLAQRLRLAVQRRNELPDGFAYQLDTALIALPEIAEWIAMERLCCPFLTFQLDIKGADCSLMLRGPDGVKPILLEFAR